MSKKRSKSRLTKTDINTICEMQRLIDAYESYIIGLVGFVNRNKPNHYVVLLRGTEMDDFVNKIWNDIKKMKEELNHNSNEKDIHTNRRDDNL